MNSTELIEKCHRIKLIVSDLDGTLFHDAKSLSDRTVSVLHQICDAGYLFTYCTARFGRMIRDTYDRFIPNAPVIRGNGCALEHPQTKALLRKKTIPYEDAKDCILFLRSINATIQLVCADHYYYWNGMLPILKNYEGLGAPMPEKLEMLQSKDIFKVMTGFTTPAQRAEMDRYFAKHPALTNVFSDDILSNATASGVDKGFGLRMLSEELGISTDEICVFGDFDNDIPMFREAGLSFAMKNGTAKTRAAADYVTPLDNNQDGVADILNRLFL